MIQNILQFRNTLQTGIRIDKNIFQSSQFLTIWSLQQNNRLQHGHRLFRYTFFPQLFVDLLQTDFVEFIDCNGYIDNLFRFSDDFGNTAQYLAII